VYDIEEQRENMVQLLYATEDSLHRNEGKEYGDDLKSALFEWFG
jgi:hypothetical protein